MEASFRMRPHVDSDSLRRQRPRSSGRPSNEELWLKHSASAPGALGHGPRPGDDPLDVRFRHQGSVPWGKRCLTHGAGISPEKKKEKVPWVDDHHVSEADDNTLLNPALRHYFDADG